MKRFKIIGPKAKKYKPKVVIRKYWSKKKHKWIKKKYEYTHEAYKTSYRGQALLVKNGKLTQHGKEVRARLMAGDMSDTFKHEVDKYLTDKEHKNIKESTLMAHLENVTYQVTHKDEIDSKEGSRNPRTFIYNMGGDVDELAEDMGISKEELLNKKNWRFVSSEEAYFTLNGVEYSFKFKYEENMITWNARKV